MTTGLVGSEMCIRDRCPVTGCPYVPLCPVTDCPYVPLCPVTDCPYIPLCPVTDCPYVRATKPPPSAGAGSRETAEDKQPALPFTSPSSRVTAVNSGRRDDGMSAVFRTLSAAKHHPSINVRKARARLARETRSFRLHARFAPASPAGWHRLTERVGEKYI